MISINFLGVTIIAKNLEDLEVALNEALALFYMASEEFGKGIKKELNSYLNEVD